MNIFPIDPVIFSIGPLHVRWYGLMYVIGFVLASFWLRILIKKKFFKVTVDKIDSLITTMILGMFVGARFFYVFVYNWDYYSQNLSELLSVWQGGLSFHGAVIGLIVSGIIFSKKNTISWLQVMDCVALSGTTGLFFGRIGNFINGELYGRITDHWIGIVFPNGGPLPRHASQLYEAVLEGVVLTVILWSLRAKVKIYGIISYAFLIGYGSFRFIVEYFREPDSQLGYFFSGYLTMGQILCLLMVLSGVVMAVIVHKVHEEISYT